VVWSNRRLCAAPGPGCAQKSEKDDAAVELGTTRQGTLHAAVLKRIGLPVTRLYGLDPDPDNYFL